MKRALPHLRAAWLGAACWMFASTAAAQAPEADRFVKCDQIWAFYNRALAAEYQHRRPQGLGGAIGDILYVSFSKVPPPACTPDRVMLATEGLAWQAAWDRRVPFPRDDLPRYKPIHKTFLIRPVQRLESYKRYSCTDLQGVPASHLGFFTNRFVGCRAEAADDAEEQQRALAEGYIKEGFR